MENTNRPCGTPTSASEQGRCVTYGRFSPRWSPTPKKLVSKATSPHTPMSKWPGPIEEELRLLQERGDRAPGIYANFFVDHAGMAPTPNQMRPLLGDLKRYMTRNPTFEDDQWATTVDCHPKFQRRSWPEEYTSAGRRRYLDLSNNRPRDHGLPPINRTRREVLRDFIGHLETTLTRLESNGGANRPCPRPLVEVGYSIKPARRLEHHAKHVSSNYLMNLWDVLQLLRYGNDFHIHQVIVYSCWNTNHAWVAEIVLTRFLQAYTWWGSGFSHYQAGRSNGSSFQRGGDQSWAIVIQESCIKQRIHDALSTGTRRSRPRYRRDKCQAAEMQSSSNDDAVTIAMTHISIHNHPDRQDEARRYHRWQTAEKAV